MTFLEAIQDVFNVHEEMFKSCSCPLSWIFNLAFFPKLDTEMK